uniref:Uncharacterized protein n=1 Tax=Tanacetum cinerariifolium TaxID=118510 RepID=A0A6L2J9W7_TANCI|nr:hypothetical protein [Tanacetum cinerariifolium]
MVNWGKRVNSVCMFEVSTILDDDSAELVARGANGFVKVSLLNSGVSLSMVVEEEAPAVSGGSRVAAEIVVDTTLGGLKYSSNIG